MGPRVEASGLNQEPVLMSLTRGKGGDSLAAYLTFLADIYTFMCFGLLPSTAWTSPAERDCSRASCLLLDTVRL